MEGQYYTVAKVPVAKSVRDEVVKMLEKDYKEVQSRPSVLGLAIPPEMSVPRYWELSICVGCTNGLLPVMTVTESIRRCMQEAIDAKRRSRESMEDIESAAGR